MLVSRCWHSLETRLLCFYSVHSARPVQVQKNANTVIILRTHDSPDSPPPAPGTPGLPGVARGIPVYPGVPRGTSGYPGGPQRTQGYLGVPRPLIKSPFRRSYNMFC
jgi:hypothetical protein